MKRTAPLLACLNALLLSACSDSGSGATAQTGAASCVAPPALSQSLPTLQDSLICYSELASANRNPVLLVPGTTLEPEPNFDWNYMPALEARGWPYCAVTLPERAMGDIQIAAEHVVYAVREMHSRSGRPVQILGYSQGGMVPRWAIRYWPDIRPMIEELVGLSPSNHGTLTAQPGCQVDCPRAYHQQKNDSAFIAALNAGFETVPGIHYSNLYTWTDEVVTPNTPPNASSTLAEAEGVANIALQDICPNNVADHFAIGSYDAVSGALAFDALTHPGPADPARIDVAVCLQPFMEGVNPASFTQDFAAMVDFVGETSAQTEMVAEEPLLKCYVES